MLKVRKEVNLALISENDNRILDAIVGETGIINRTHNDAICPPLDEALHAATTWTDLSIHGRLSAGRSGSHVWVHDCVLQQRVLIITDESARKAA